MTRALDDLVRFARLEVESGDIEPWAAVLAELHRRGTLDTEQALWAVKLYNAFDDFGSAFRLAALWPTPAAWAASLSHDPVKAYPCSQERRNLRGGRVIHHLNSYVDALHGQSQMSWLREAIPPDADPYQAFNALMPYVRRIWGTGRLSAFEWVEFVAKVVGVDAETTDACLWESSGPRESLQRLYDNPNPSVTWLNVRAAQCKEMLAGAGVVLSWWDFETVICDFNVMRKGRYYPGKHIAMVREEIEGLPDPVRGDLASALRAVVPEPWCDIAPGPDKVLAQAYAATGNIHTPTLAGVM